MSTERTDAEDAVIEIRKMLEAAKDLMSEAVSRRNQAEVDRRVAEARVTSFLSALHALGAEP